MSRPRSDTRASILPILVLLLLVGTAQSRRKSLSLVQLRALAQRAGFPDPDVAAAVAMAESGGYPGAVGDGGISRGLWQINIAAHPQMAWDDLFDPDKNAKAALQLSNGGADWTPWTMYRNGAYKRFLGGGAS